MPSPVGDLLVVADAGALVKLHFLPWTPPDEPPAPDDPLLAEAARQLGEYFAGERHDFDLPVAPPGTPFQRRVWEELRRIPYGTTTTYGAIADAVGSPSAVRAVGAANGRNPVGIVVPCHRVVGSDGRLRGFGGGVERKEQLLALESLALF